MAAEKVNFTIRRAKPDDYKAIYQIYSGPRVVWGTTQLPFPSAELFRKCLTEPPEGTFTLVVCAKDEVVGQLALHTFPSHPRRRHVGQIGMSVRDDWQGKGAGNDRTC